mgnify:FL=1
MIQVERLTKKFQTHTALNQISVSVQPGSVFGLVGSNGAGKSTLLRTIAGIYKPDSGTVAIDGTPIFEHPSVKNDIFFISDFPYFIPQSNMKEMAKFYASMYSNWSHERYRELCSLFPIEEKMKISSMSKGMQRQVALICALSTQPKVLLMDEIFDGLDPVMRQLLKKLLAREVSERNITVMIASHNLRELEDVCDHVGLLHQGGVVFEQELDGLKLNLHKLQAVFKPMISMDVFSDLDILKFDMKGSLINMVIRGDKGVISRRIEALKPVYFEMLPLTLEEVFISEMEVSGYDIDKIIP